MTDKRIRGDRKATVVVRLGTSDASLAISSISQSLEDAFPWLKGRPETPRQRRLRALPKTARRSPNG